jgi:hypothetical protein
MRKRETESKGGVCMCFGEFTFQANVDLGQDLASLM